jgi:hypothetical protein
MDEVEDASSTMLFGERVAPSKRADLRRLDFQDRNQLMGHELRLVPYDAHAREQWLEQLQRITESGGSL